MKRLLSMMVVVVVFSCQPGRQEVKVAGIQEKVQDSLLQDEKFQFSLWMTKTYYALKSEGLSNKKAWLHIDSLTHQLYRGLPKWYLQLKQESDSLMKEKNKYRRKRIV